MFDKVSVIIRNRNEEDFIGFALQSVSDFLPNSEIIIIDNKSSDDSMKIVNWFDKENIKIYSTDSYSPGSALNLGVQNASNEVILLLSAHCQICNIDLNLVENFLKSEYEAVFGRQIPIYRGKKITPRYIWSHFHNRKLSVNMFSDIEHRQFLHNAFCFYNRQILLDFPFDEDLAGKEDRYWAMDCVKRGKEYIYDPLVGTVNHFWTPNGNTWKGIG